LCVSWKSSVKPAATFLTGFVKGTPKCRGGQIIGLRNKIIHGYFNVNLRIVWEITQNDLPPLKQQVERILRMLGKGHGESEKQ